MMRLVEELVQTAFAQAVGYALLHFVWEGAIVGLLLAMALYCLRPSRARLRYGVCCAALGALPVLFAVTFWWNLSGEHSGNFDLKQPWDGVHISATGSGGGLPSPSRRWVDFLPWLAPVWMAGVIAVWARVLAAWLMAQRLRRMGVCVAAPEWQERLQSIKRRMRISRPAVLLESCLSDVPAVMGWLRPAILMPVGLLAGLPGEQVEAFLIHELAHVGRLDYLVNLAQSLVEGLLFYHPAVWWISGKVREERENCCDDAVVALTGDARGYAAALTMFDERRWAAADAVLAANGGPLMRRIHRLLQPGRQTPAMAPITVLLLASACVAVAAWRPLPSKTMPLQIAAAPATAPAESKTADQVQAQEQQDQAVERVRQQLRGVARERRKPDDLELDELKRRIEQMNQLQVWAQAKGLEKGQFQEQLNREMELVNRELEQLNRDRIHLDRLKLEEFNRRVERANEVLAQAQAQAQALAQQAASPYEKWLQEDVAYIITDEERAAFQRLQTDEERQHFIEQFWDRRDPTPGTPRNEFKEEHYRRIAYALDNFGFTGMAGWRTDRGRIYIRYGPPDERRVYEKGGVSSDGKPMVRPFEVWRYRYIQGVGNDVFMEFVDSAGTGDYRMTRDPAAP